MKIENILFWMLIALITGIAIWKLIGSPTDTATIISVTLFMVGSEIILWKAFFSMEKKVSIGFIKIKNEIENNSDRINNRLNSIENLVKNKT